MQFCSTAHMQSKQTVGIIGSGIAGLASSIHLAHKGYQVQVFEQGPTYGGKLGVAQLGSYRFDLGPSLFTLPQLVWDLLDSDLKDNFHVQRLETLCHYFYDHKNKPFHAHAEIDQFVQEAAQYFEESPDRIRKFMAHSKRVYDITAPVFLASSLHKPATYFSKNGRKGIANLWRLNMFQTMNGALTKQFNNPDLIQLFNRYATYNGSNPYQAPATLNVIPHLEFFYGAYLPLNGMRAIADVLYEQAVRLGVCFYFNTAIEGVEYDAQNRISTLIDAQQRLYPIDICVSNIDVKRLYRHVLNKTVPKKIEKAENSSSALIFYWGIKQKFPQLDVHNILFSNDYPEEFDALFARKTLQIDPTVYINITSKHIQTDAPEYGENWFVMINAAHDTGQYTPQYLAEVRTGIIAKINRVLQIDIESLIEVEDRLDPVGIAHSTGSDKGSLYGSSSNDRMSAFFRQANFSSEHKNLYFCGGSVHPGGGIPLCLLGASIVNKLIPDANR